MNHLISILFLYLLFTNGLSVTEYRVLDSCNNDYYRIQIAYNDDKRNLQVFLLDDDHKKVDSLNYTNLAWGATKKVLKEKWVNIKFSLRGGSGSFYEKELMIGVCSGKLIENLNLMVREMHELLDQANETYTVSLNGDTLVEKYELNSTIEIDTDWDNSCILKYSKSHNVFYTNIYKFKNLILNNEKLSGEYFCLLLKRYSYIFYNNKWYLIDEDNILYRM